MGVSKNIQNNSVFRKLLEAFMVTFFSTFFGSIGTVIDSQNMPIIALFSGIGAIVGYLLYRYCIKPQPFYFKNIKFSRINFLKTTYLLPFIYAIVVLLISILLYDSVYQLVVTVFNYPKIMTWVLNLSILGAIPAAISLTTSEIRQNGLEKSVVGILKLISQFILFHVFFSVYYACISLIVVFVFFMMSSFLRFVGVNFSGEKNYSHETWIVGLIVVDMFIIFSQNKDWLSEKSL